MESWVRQNIGGLALAALPAAAAAALALLYSNLSLDPLNVPVQPIFFSHKRHAGQLGIDCRFCHRSVEMSSAAGIPTVKLCIDCHRAIARQPPKAGAIMTYWRRQAPIPWVRVQKLPDFVYFSHTRHLEGGISCVDCHGHAERRSGIPRAAAFEMGWCITCHRGRGISDDCLTCHR